jgi:hypothetical protein
MSLPAFGVRGCSALSNWITAALAVSLCLFLEGCASQSSSESISGAGRTVTVAFANPDKLIDIQLTGRSRDDSLPEIQRVFTQALTREMGRFPTGTQLTLTFTEIDLAGWIPPNRGRSDVRVVSQAYPARLEFDYTLQQAVGAANLNPKGHETLTSFGDFQQFSGTQNQSLPVETSLLKTWVRKLAASSK